MTFFSSRRSSSLSNLDNRSASHEQRNVFYAKSRLTINNIESLDGEWVRERNSSFRYVSGIQSIFMPLYIYVINSLLRLLRTDAGSINYNLITSLILDYNSFCYRKREWEREIIVNFLCRFSTAYAELKSINFIRNSQPFTYQLQAIATPFSLTNRDVKMFLQIVLNIVGVSVCEY